MTTPKNRFDQAAADWDKKQLRLELGKAVAGAISGLPLNKEMKAMEYGCGTGLVGLRIAPLVQHLTAIDTSTGMLEVLKEKIISQGIANVTPRFLDLTSDISTDRYDFIFSAMTLHHIHDATKLIKTLFTMLHPKGLLALADLDQEDGSFHGPEAIDVHHHGFDRKDLHSQLSRLGLSEITDETVHVFRRTDEKGTDRGYRVFLLTGRK